MEQICPSKNPLYRLEKEMANQGFNKKTAKSYIYYISNLLKYSSKSPRDISSVDIISFLEELVRQKKSRSTLNTAHSAFKFYFEKILGRKFFSPKGRIARAKLQKQPPVSLTEKEIDKLLANTKRVKYRLIFQLMSESGLRISEITNLQLGDMDFENKTVKIKKVKKNSRRDGGLEREIKILSETSRNIKKFTLGHDKNDFLFTNQKDGRLTERAIQKTFIASLRKSNIYKPATCNSLRHSFAFNLAKEGLPPEKIQETLGHKLKESSKIYIKIKNDAKIKKKIQNLIYATVPKKQQN